MTNIGSRPRAVGLVRAWVRLYTAGLPPALRDARREEINADIWEQAQETAVRPRTGPPLALHLLHRWLLGLPDDLLWRLAHLRTRNLHPKEGAMVHANDYKTLTILTGTIAVLLLAALVTYTVAAEIEYQRQADYGFVFHWVYLVTPVSPVSLAAIVVGFWFMPKGPMLGALLVTSGSLAIAIMFYWLIVPELIAIGLSLYAFRRARRIQAHG